MKKILISALVLCAILNLGVYVYGQAGTGVESIPKTDQLEYEVSFENAKLVDTQIDEKTGVKVEGYIIED